VIGAAASGISLGVAGGTHHALEDLALMRSLPHMTVIVPADVDEAYQATLATLDIDGPVYLRLGGRVEEPSVSADVPFRLGKAVTLRTGNDIAIIACGALVEMALRASDALRAEGIGARVLVMHTLKPFDGEAVLTAAAETGAIVTAEEHQVNGGLGGAVAEVLVRTHPVPVEMVAVMDRFGQSGKPAELMAAHGIDAKDVIEAIERVLPRKGAPAHA